MKGDDRIEDDRRSEIRDQRTMASGKENFVPMSVEANETAKFDSSHQHSSSPLKSSMH